MLPGRLGRWTRRSRVGCWDARLPVTCVPRGPRLLAWWLSRQIWRDVRARAPAHRSCACSAVDRHVVVRKNSRTLRKAITRKYTSVGRGTTKLKNHGVLRPPSPHAPGNRTTPSLVVSSALRRRGNKRRLAGRPCGNVTGGSVATLTPHSSPQGVERHVRTTDVAANTIRRHAPAVDRLPNGRARRARPTRVAIDEPAQPKTRAATLPDLREVPHQARGRADGCVAQMVTRKAGAGDAGSQAVPASRSLTHGLQSGP